MSSSPLLANTIPETETRTSVLILSVSMIKLSNQTASNFKKFNHGHFAIRNWVSRGKAKLHSCVGFYGCQHFPTPPLCFFFLPRFNACCTFSPLLFLSFDLLSSPLSRFFLHFFFIYPIAILLAFALFCSPLPSLPLFSFFP